MAVVGVVVVVSIVVAVGWIRLGDRALSDSVGQENNSALSPFLTCVALVFGALLGFTVVVAWEQFSSAEANVTNEASTLATMYRQTVGMPAAEQTQMRDLLRTYANAVRGPEWAQQEGNDGTSDTARGAIANMYHVLSSQDPSTASSPVNGEFLSQLTTLASQRNTRVLDTDPRIPWLLWCGLLFGGVVLVGLMGFMRLESRRVTSSCPVRLRFCSACCCSSSTLSTTRSARNWASPHSHSSTPWRCSMQQIAAHDG